MPISHSYGKWISTYSRRQRRRHTVATERQRVLPFPRKGGVDKTLDKGVVDTVTPVFQVSEELMPEMMQVIHSIIHQFTAGEDDHPKSAHGTYCVYDRLSP